MWLITSLQCFLFSPGPKQWYLSRFYRFGAYYFALNDMIIQKYSKADLQ